MTTVPDISGRDLAINQGPTIIALSGYARSGKDTVADFLVVEHGFRRIAFADRLRDATRAFDPIVARGLLPWIESALKHAGFDRKTLSEMAEVAPGASTRPVYLSELLDEIGYHAAKEFPEVRRAYQRMGTEVGRDTFSQRFWVDQTMHSIDTEPERKWVITDARFVNEATAVKAKGGSVWRIERDGYGPANDHPSETALDTFPFDETLTNNATIADLRSDVEERLLRTIDRH